MMVWKSSEIKCQSNTPTRIGRQAMLNASSKRASWIIGMGISPNAKIEIGLILQQMAMHPRAESVDRVAFGVEGEESFDLDQVLLLKIHRSSPPFSRGCASLH